MMFNKVAVILLNEMSEGLERLSTVSRPPSTILGQLSSATIFHPHFRLPNIEYLISSSLRLWSPFLHDP